MNYLKQVAEQFGPINDTEFNELLSVSTQKNIKKGACFIRQGEICQQSAFIEKGIFRHYLTDKSGREKILQFSMPHEFISDCDSFMHQQPALYAIEAIADSRLIIFSNAALKKLSAHNPVFDHINNHIVQQVLSGYKEHLMIVMNLSPGDRYQYLLDNKPDLILRVSITHLSQYLGLSRETLSRLRAKTTSRIK